MIAGTRLRRRYFDSNVARSALLEKINACKLVAKCQCHLQQCVLPHTECIHLRGVSASRQHNPSSNSKPKNRNETIEIHQDDFIFLCPIYIRTEAIQKRTYSNSTFVNNSRMNYLDLIDCRHRTLASHITMCTTHRQAQPLHLQIRSSRVRNFITFPRSLSFSLSLSPSHPIFLFHLLNGSILLLQITNHHLVAC